MADQPLNKLVITEDEARERAQVLGLPFIRLQGREISRDILKLIPEAVARQNLLIAYEKVGNNLKIAVGNPDKLQEKAPQFLTDLKKNQGYGFTLAVTLPEDIEYALNLYQPAAGLPAADLKTIEISPEILNKFPREVAEKYQMICFAAPREDHIKVGLVNPADAKMREILEFVKKRNGIETEEYQISPADFQYALGLYDKKAAPAVSVVKKELSVTKKIPEAAPPSFPSTPMAKPSAAPAKAYSQDELTKKAVFLSDKEFELAEREEKISREEKRIQQASQQLAAGEKQFSEQKANLTQAQTKLGQELLTLEHDQGELNRTKGELASLKQELATQMQILEQKEKDLQVLERSVEGGQKKLVEDLKNYQEEKSRLQEKTALAEEKERQLAAKETRLAEENQKVWQQKQRLNVLRVEISKQVKVIQKEKEDLAAREEKAKQAYELLAYLEKEKAELAQEKEKIATAQNQLQNLELARQELLKDQENLRQQKERLAEKEVEQAKTSAEVQRQKKEISHLRQQIEEEKTSFSVQQAALEQDKEALAKSKDQLEQEKAALAAAPPEPVKESGQTEEELAQVKKQLEQAEAELAAQKQELAAAKQDLEKRPVQPAEIPQAMEPPTATVATPSEPEESSQPAPESARAGGPASKPWWKMDVKDIPGMLGVKKKSGRQPAAKEERAEIFQPVETPFWQEEAAAESGAPAEVAIPEPAKPETVPPLESVAPPKESLPSKPSHPIAGASGEKVAGMVEENILDNHFSKGIKNKEELTSIVKSGFVPKLVAGIIYLAATMNASDIHLEPLEKTFRLRYRVDGILKDILEMPLALQPAVVSRIKILCKMKIDENRIPQDGRFEVKVKGREIDLRVSTFPTAHGEKAELRLLDKSAALFKMEDLGLEGENFQKIQTAITKPYGVILVTGPTGSGKTTTLYAVLNKLSRPSVNIVTLEDPVEYDIAGVNQCQVNPRIGFTFAEGLRSILRQDPNIIMVGEIRDKETAELATHAALTGHLVLSTLHTNDAAGALPRLIDMGIEPFLITSSINAIVAQRLVRRICPKCQQEDKVPPSILQKLQEEIKAATSPDMAVWKSKPLKFYKSKGCADCEDGYHGRTAIYEVLSMSPELEEMTINHKTSDELFQQAHQEGMMSLRENGILKALEGLTTLDEVFRVTETA